MIKKVECNQFAGINDIKVDFSDGINLIIGKNETGKSNILDAMSFLQQYNEEVPVDFLSIRNQQNEADIVSVFYTMESENASAYRKHISSALKIPEDILNKISVTSATKEIYLQEDNELNEEWVFTFKPLTLSNKYFNEKITEAPGKVVNGIQQPPQKKNNIEIISAIELKKLPEDQQAEFNLLTKEKLEEILIPVLEKYYNKHEISISIWKTSPNYLIQDSISLKDFAQKPSQYPPLKNIFALSL